MAHMPSSVWTTREGGAEVKAATQGIVAFAIVAVVLSGFFPLSRVRTANAGEPQGKKRPRGEFTNGIGMRFVRVPPGDFAMGTTQVQGKSVVREYGGPNQENLAREMPAHKVRLTREYFIGKFEVTVSEFRQFVKATGHRTDAEKWAPRQRTWQTAWLPLRDNCPVTCVSWSDAKKFAEWLNGNDKAKPDGWVYRLPTEPEWEYACRGPKGLRFPWGNVWDGSACNHADLKGMGDDGFFLCIAPVGSFSPKGDSPFGVCDMVGNVWEWCEDRFAPYPKGEQVDPVGPETGGLRVTRGGGFNEGPQFDRSTARVPWEPGKSFSDHGFRLVLVPGAK